ncbi:hypothetical protein DFQ29_006773 [Apophysomyces sp. BC1021]|nr:hypothetical protein DFQ29_006773 [Apophysomyces sp. BC1021]
MNLTLEALPHWLQWNEERVSMGLEPVFHQDGVLVLSSHGRFSDFDSNSMQCIREAGYGHVIEELRTPSSITERYPHLEHAVSKGYNIGYLNKQGGWCNSAEAVKHIYHKCLQNGVHFILGNQGCLDKLHCDPKDPSNVLGIQTIDGKTHLAHRVLLATGSWTPGIVNVSNQLVATGQIVVQFQPSKSTQLYSTSQPVWCADLSRTGRPILGFCH